MKKILIAAALSAWIAPAFAAPAAATAPEKGFYAGADIGSGKVRIKNCSGTCLSSSKNDQVVGGILLGYQYNKNLAVEAKFTGTGKWERNTAPTGDIKGDAFALVGVGIAPVTNELSVYAKLGVANMKSKVSNSAALGYKDTRNTSATGGLGAQYNVTSAIGVRLGYDYYRGKVDATAGGGDARLNCDVWTAGVIFRF